MERDKEFGPPTLRQDFTERVGVLWRRSRAAVIELGNVLIEAKEKLKHGEFTSWIENDLPFGADSAQRFMRIAQDPRISNADPGQVLPESVRALDQLRRLPSGAFERALAAGAIHPDMTVSEAYALVQNVAREYSDYANHRPDADKISAPTSPADGVARCYAELIWLLRKERINAGMTGFDLDERIKELGLGVWPDRYAEKLENPHEPHGRSASPEKLNLWLRGLGIGLAVVRLT